MKKGKEKQRKTENYIKNGEKGLKISSLWVINFFKNSGEKTISKGGWKNEKYITT